MAELIAGLLLLIDRYGLLAFVVAFMAVTVYMFSRTWTKSRDSRTAIANNANDAQEMINKRVTLLETEKVEQDKRIEQLQAELNETRDTLRKARGRIARLTRQLATLEEEKGTLTTERDQLRSDLDTASGRIHDLEIQVARLEEQLKAEEHIQTTTVKPILDLLQRMTPPVPTTLTTDGVPSVVVDTVTTITADGKSSP